MAKSNNKYTSINFNHILDKAHLPSSSSAPTTTRPQSSSSASSYASISARTHGRMLVLTRPAPKPVSTPAAASTTPSLSPSPSLTAKTHQATDQARTAPDPAEISLRPLGRTGTGSSTGHERDKEVVVTSQVTESPKPNRFIPPHLRPGFAGREEKPGPEVFREQQQPHHQHQGNFGSPGRAGGTGRPKSGGYERIRMGGESDLGSMSRPGSRGNRPSSSG